MVCPVCKLCFIGLLSKLHLVMCTAIPTEPQGGNHTRSFAKSAASPESHAVTLNVAKALAAVGMRVLTDDTFFQEVSDSLQFH
jgi:hypothetical protein